MNPLYLVWTGAVVNLAAGLHYAYRTVRSPTGEAQPKPNPVSWGIWSLSGWLAFSAQVAEGVRGEALLTLCVAAVPTFIFCAALISRRRYGPYAPVGCLDFTCGALAIVALAAWRITASGSVAVALSIICDSLVAIPVIRQAYRDPLSDEPSIWLAGAFNAFITLATFQSVTFIESGFALYFLCLCLVVSFLLVGRASSRRRDEPSCAAVLAPDAQRLPAQRDAGHDDTRETSAAFAGAFAADYLSWDELDPLPRTTALTTYIDVPADPLWGWSGRGRQYADLVLIEGAELTADGYYVVDLRVRVAPIERGASGSKPRSIVVASGAAVAASDTAIIEEIDIPLPGSSRDLESEKNPEDLGAGRWIRLQVPVVMQNGYYRIPT